MDFDYAGYVGAEELLMAEKKMCPIMMLGFTANSSFGAHSLEHPANRFERFACVRERCQWWIIEKARGSCGFLGRNF